MLNPMKIILKKQKIPQNNDKVDLCLYLFIFKILNSYIIEFLKNL